MKNWVLALAITAAIAGMFVSASPVRAQVDPEDPGAVDPGAR